MARSDTAGLRIVHDPGRTAAGASLASLAVCLAFAAYFGQALYRGSPGPSGDPGVDTLLFAGFVLGAVFFVGWTLHSLRGRRKTLRIYQVERGEVVCRGGAGEHPLRALGRCAVRQRLQGLLEQGHPHAGEVASSGHDAFAFSRSSAI
jgi:hypothetical protein